MSKKLRDVFWAMEKAEKYVKELIPDALRIEFLSVKHQKDNWFVDGFVVVEVGIVERVRYGYEESGETQKIKTEKVARAFRMRFRDLESATLRAFEVDNAYSHNFEMFFGRGLKRK